MSLSEVCSESQSRSGVYLREKDFQESHGYTSQCRGSHLAVPHHARCFCLQEGPSLQRPFLLQPLRNLGLLFLFVSPWRTRMHERGISLFSACMLLLVVLS